VAACSTTIEIVAEDRFELFTHILDPSVQPLRCPHQAPKVTNTSIGSRPAWK